MFGAVVVEGIMIESFPCRQELRVLRPGDRCGIAGFQRIAGQGIKIVVLFSRGDYLGRMRVIVDGFDLVDFRQQLRISSLGGSGNHQQNRQERSKESGDFHSAERLTRSRMECKTFQPAQHQYCADPAHS